MSDFKVETKCLHSGYTPSKGEPCALPIYQSTTYKYDTTDEMGQLFDLKAEGYFYTRLQNPTNDAVVDNTFATPVNCRPFEWGADIVTHSTTKYMDGHAVQVGGAIVDSGNFDWDAYGHKYHGLTEPDESYHGVIYTKQFGKKAYITKATSQLMRDLGSIPSPTNCFLLNLGLL